MIYNLGVNYTKQFTGDKFENIEFYNKFARAIVKRYVPKNVRLNFFNNDEIMSYIAYQIMVADEKWDGTGTKDGYRFRRGKWAVSHIIRVHNNKVPKEGKNVSIYSSKKGEAKKEIADFIQDSSGIDNHENNELLSKIIEFITTDNDICNPQQRTYMRQKFLEGMRNADIAREHKISRERVGQVIKTSIERIRQALNVQEQV